VVPEKNCSGPYRIFTSEGVTAHECAATEWKTFIRTNRDGVTVAQAPPKHQRRLVINPITPLRKLEGA
jgi:hypothetical protein